MSFHKTTPAISWQSKYKALSLREQLLFAPIGTLYVMMCYYSSEATFQMFTHPRWVQPELEVNCSEIQWAGGIGEVQHPHDLSEWGQKHRLSWVVFAAHNLVDKLLCFCIEHNFFQALRRVMSDWFNIERLGRPCLQTFDGEQLHLLSAHIFFVHFYSPNNLVFILAVRRWDPWLLVYDNTDDYVALLHWNHCTNSLILIIQKIVGLQNIVRV